MIDIERDLKALIVNHLNAGTADTELLVQVQQAVDKLRQERQSRADAASMRRRLRYCLFIDSKGQRIRVAEVDLPDFCREHLLSLEKMTELALGGRNGLPEYRGYKRGPGSNALMVGQPYMSVPEPDPSLDDEPSNVERRMFKPKPQPVAYNHKPTQAYIPPQERISHVNH